jgi:putative ABC transport system permease protein
MWGWTQIEMLARDLRYGWRVLWRPPGVSAAGALTLAIGLGASTAMFGVLRSVPLRPVPIKTAERNWVKTAAQPRSRR